jgi:NADH:ubiquinone oxidoreductase subunit H
MKIFAIMALFLLLMLVDLPKIIKKTSGKLKYLIVYGFIITLGFTISLLQAIEKAPTSPAKTIEFIVKAIIGGM